MNHNTAFSDITRSLTYGPYTNSPEPAGPSKTSGGYSEVHGCIYYRERTKDGPVDKCVCNFTAEIETETRGEQGEVVFNIVGKVSTGKQFSLAIDAEDFTNERKLAAAITKAAGACAIVFSRMRPHLAPAIASLSDRTETRALYTRTGWADGRFLIGNHVPISADLSLPAQCPYHLDADADLTLGLEALDALVNAQAPEMAFVALAAFFLAPAAHRAGLRNDRYATMIYGPTGSYKTSWAKVAMSLYGASFLEDTALLKWDEGGTVNAMIRIATHASDVPLLIDNYRPDVRGGKEGFVTLQHSLMEGSEKSRLNRDIGLSTTKPILAWPVYTGEELPDVSASTLARLLAVPFAAKDGLANPSLTKAQRLADHLSSVGMAWIDWLESKNSDQPLSAVRCQFGESRTAWQSYLTRSNPDIANPGRVASGLAANELVGVLLAACPATAHFYKKYESVHKAGLEAVAEAMAQHTVDATPSTRFVAGIRQLIASGSYILVARNAGPSLAERKRKPVIGYVDGDGIYVLPDVARRAVDSLFRSAGGLQGISSTTLYRQLKASGVLARVGAKQTTVSVQVGAGDSATHARLLHFVPRALGHSTAPSGD